MANTIVSSSYKGEETSVEIHRDKFPGGEDITSLTLDACGVRVILFDLPFSHLCRLSLELDHALELFAREEPTSETDPVVS